MKPHPNHHLHKMLSVCVQICLYVMQKVAFDMQNACLASGKREL